MAVKQPKFQLDPDKGLSLAGEEAQAQLETIYAEIKALTTPELQEHPGIVQLLSWSADFFSFYGPITLVMELALSDLYYVLRERGPLVSPEDRYFFATDIATGLDAIHRCGFVHGDLKPANVLIFVESGHPFAKLADFGLSVPSDLHRVDRRFWPAGTPGWQSPEVAAAGPWDPLGAAYDAAKADNYSFGLVIWSIFYYSGLPPPSFSHEVRRREGIATVVAANTDTTEPWMSSLVADALWALLDEVPARRPETVYQLLPTDKLVDETAYRYVTFRLTKVPVTLLTKHALGTLPCSLRNPIVDEEGQDDAVDDSTDEFDPNNPTQDEVKPLPFEPPSMPGHLSDALLLLPLHRAELMNPDILFCLFLTLVTSPVHQAKTAYTALDLIRVAAKRGSLASQALIPGVLAFHGHDVVSLDREPCLREFLMAGVASGSVSVKKYLRRLDSPALAEALEDFRYNGGYGKFYYRAPECGRLPYLATNDTAEELKEFLALARPPLGIDMEERTPDGETALYLACARGAWDMAVQLLDEGADASASCTEFGITPLHWLFAFEEPLQPAAAARMIQSGGEINALALCPLPFLHYPFTLPTGTPLHWAVATASHETIKILLQLGADPTCRDGSDPYKFDGRVRPILQFGGIHQDGYSIPSGPTRGLSSLDTAARDHSPYIFELLLVSDGRVHVDINDADEEGFAAIHRLADSPERVTRMESWFSFLPFRGSPSDHQADLKRTATAIKLLGGHLDALTTPQAIVELSKGRTTPLMLAVLEGLPTTVRALLSVGCNAAVQNERGETALHCFPSCDYGINGRADQDSFEIAQALIAAGAPCTGRDDKGNTPLVYAAWTRSLRAIDLLLSHGADIEDTERNVDSMSRGSDLLHILSGSAYDSSDERYDTHLARFLHKWLLNCDGAEKRVRVASMCDGNGLSVLYRFAQNTKPIPRSVDVLLRCSAPVNIPVN